MNRNLNRWQLAGLATIMLVFALMVGRVCHAETLQCYPAHTPTKFVDGGMSQDSALFGLVVSIGAILFLL